MYTLNITKELIALNIYKLNIAKQLTALNIYTLNIAKQLTALNIYTLNIAKQLIALKNTSHTAILECDITIKLFCSKLMIYNIQAVI